MFPKRAPRQAAAKHHPQPIAPNDKEVLYDLLETQRQLTAVYNSGACGCTDSALKTDVLQMLRAEHNLYTLTQAELEKRGATDRQPAAQAAIDAAKQKYEPRK